MTFPETRMQRLRSTEKMRELVAETHLDVSDLILPVFFNESISKPTSTTSMPGILTHPLADYEKISSEIQRNDLNSVILFGIPSKKDSAGSQAYVEDGVVQKAIKGLKKSSDLLIITDLCLCEYTDHGHCGVLHNGSIDNDETISLYARTAVSQADAGADIIAPSGMMDGQVAAIREALDDAGHKNVAIMAYSAKFQSSFYGPFRDLARSSPEKGDRSAYQMQCGNRREALREMELDISEGADIIMVKPAMSYLDVIYDARNSFGLPIAAYQVSGEYSMIKAAGANGWIDEKRAMMESLLSIKRAGADMIITYFAEAAARLLR